GGVLFFLASLIGKAAAIALDILLTIFFFSLLLNQLALFANNSSLKSRSEYLVRSVFNGKWLPGATEESLAEGERIISEIIRKLQNWVRGYGLLIMIDFVVYTTVFLLLEVPYAPILGFIAASALLLPYIGPITSALLTLLVTFAVCGSDVTGLQMAGIIGIYLLENGIVEQFFLYPAVIGESLGLTTLETIIVVLLGGYFAGITGMIFAMPTAAVLKYLIPQIYNCWR
ncbi:MAG: AI-2E family transporter, partial [Lentisphaeria bacterium]|nr:AI-2E family transporter [Lentisphaeria bacterium]